MAEAGVEDARPTLHDDRSAQTYERVEENIKEESFKLSIFHTLSYPQSRQPSLNSLVDDGRRRGLRTSWRR